MKRKYEFPTTLLTTRFIIRRAQSSDDKAIFDGWAGDRDVTRYLSWKCHQSIQDTREFLEYAENEWINGTSFPSVIAYRVAPETLIGMIHPRLEDTKISYGWLVRKSQWGKGVATEVVRHVIHHDLSHPQIYRAEAICDVDNHASARVMEKAGMEKEGLLRRLAIQPNYSNEPRDCYIYAKIKETEFTL